MRHKIKNIIFDLGGVIMNLDVSKTIKAFQELGITNIVNKTGHHYTNQVFYDFEIGKISDKEFLKEISNMSDRKASINDIKHAWNEMILDMPKGRVDFILNLKNEYNLYLLSNTNSIHQKKFEQEFEREYDFSFIELFKRAYYSHEMGMRKPNEEIFCFVLNNSCLVAEETLFIDDSIDNIRTAQKNKIKTYHVTNKNSSKDLEIIFNTLKNW